MNEKELISRLHEHEKTILKALEDGTKDMNDLEKITELQKDSLEKASLWSKVKGVLKIDEKVFVDVFLTKEGLDYVKSGLPERNLLKEIEKGENDISKLKTKVKKFNVGLVWVKKNGWVNIKKGKLELTNKGNKILNQEFIEEKTIFSLSNGKKPIKEFDKDIIEKLEKRGLIKELVKKERKLSLTDLGKKIVPKIVLNQEIGQITPNILKNKQWKTKTLRSYDIHLPCPKVYPAKKHFLNQVIEYIRQIWLELGFKEMTGPMLDLSFWNFDALYQPQDHPARDMADTFYMKMPKKGKLPNKNLIERVKATHEYGWTCNSNGWQYKWNPEIAENCVLRTHTTSLSARILANLKEEDLPVKFFSIGRCFRNETIDWKHLAEFYQTDGIVVGEGVTFRHLLGYLKRFFTKLGFPKARFRPAYFPYTELSTEIEVWHPENKQWLELGGAGIFRPEVVKPLLGKDIPVLAWGPGFGRIVMMNYKLKDIRDLYTNNLEQLRNAKMWLK